MVPDVETEEIILESHEATCIFEEYVCSDKNLQCSSMLSSADIVALPRNVEVDDSRDARNQLPVVTYCKPHTAFETVVILFVFT